MKRGHIDKVASAPVGMRAFLRAESGAIAVEFGYLLPVLLVLILAAGEIGFAISDQLTVQAAARAGTHYGLKMPPSAGNLGPVINSVKAALPANWQTPTATNKPVVAATIECECEFTGPIQCGLACAKGERSQSYLKVDVSKVHASVISLRGWKPQLTLKNSSRVRLQ